MKPCDCRLCNPPGELAACQEAYLNASEEASMAEAYYEILERHLKTHGCDHDLAVVANDDDPHA